MSQKKVSASSVLYESSHTELVVNDVVESNNTICIKKNNSPSSTSSVAASANDRQKNTDKLLESITTTRVDLKRPINFTTAKTALSPFN